MKINPLLLSVAALAAGIFTAQAQSNTYSANVVGYAIVVYPGNGQFTMLANPFDDGAGNVSSNILDSANMLPAKSQILTWNTVGQTFSIIQKTAAGWPSTTPLPPGVGFFVRNGSPGGGSPAVTNLFVGSVIVLNDQCITNPIPLAFSLQGTPIPYAGNLAIGGQTGGDPNLPYSQTLGTKSQILTWNTGSQVYNINQRTASSWPSTTFINPTDGFFINNKSGPATNIVECLDLQ